MASSSMRTHAHFAAATLAEPEQPVAPNTAAPIPDLAQQRNQRRAVKAMAREFENDYRAFRTVLQEHFAPDRVEGFASRCEQRQEALDDLRRLPLNQAAPLPSRQRSARSAALLAGAMVARANAAVVGGIGYATQGAARIAALALESAVATPVRGIENMLQTAATYRRAQTLRNPASPMLTIQCASVCGAVVGMRGFAEPALRLPAELKEIARHSTGRGSLGYSLFTLYDQFPQARTHVNYKSMSTAAIAEHATERLRIGLADATRIFGFQADPHFHRQVLVGPRR